VTAVRRNLLLATLVVFGLVLVAIVQPPTRRSGIESTRGHRVFRGDAAAVRAVTVRLDGRWLAAQRTPGGWELEGRTASAIEASALTDLVSLLTTLRAVDVFRSDHQDAFGLSPPRGLVELDTARQRWRLALGGFTAGSTTLYARREGDPRVLSVGTLLLSAIERVLNAAGQRPEMG